MKSNKFAKLRQEIKRYGTVAEFAAAIGCEQHSVYAKLRGNGKWNLTEIYAAMELLEIPPDKFSEYFPKDGEAPESWSSVQFIPMTSRMAEFFDRYDHSPHKFSIDTLLGLNGSKAIEIERRR